MPLDQEAFCFVTGCISPDGSGILFLAAPARKRYSEQQETAPEKLSFLIQCRA